MRITYEPDRDVRVNEYYQSIIYAVQVLDLVVLRGLKSNQTFLWGKKE